MAISAEFSNQELLETQGDIQQQLAAIKSQTAHNAAMASGAVQNVYSTTLTVSRAGDSVNIDIPGTVLTGVYIHATASLNFDLTAVTYQDLTIGLSGALVGDTVFLGVDPAAILADLHYWAFVSAADTVTVRAFKTAGAPNPPNSPFKVGILR